MNSTNVTSRHTTAYHEIARYIDLYYLPIIIVLGMLGNALSFIVYSRRNQKKKPLSIYMRALSCADTVIMLLAGADWLNNHFIEQRSELRCITTSFVQHVTFNICEYILVAIAFSRLVAILFPIKAAKTTTRPKVLYSNHFVFHGSSCMLFVTF